MWGDQFIHYFFSWGGGECTHIFVQESFSQIMLHPKFIFHKPSGSTLKVYSGVVMGWRWCGGCGGEVVVDNPIITRHSVELS